MKEWEYALKSLKKRIINPDLLRTVMTNLSAQSIIKMNNLTDEQLKYGEEIFTTNEQYLCGEGKKFFKLSKEEQKKDDIREFNKLCL